jgi:hypothetical protein
MMLGVSKSSAFNLSLTCVFKNDVWRFLFICFFNMRFYLRFSFRWGVFLFLATMYVGRQELHFI